MLARRSDEVMTFIVPPMAVHLSYKTLSGFGYGRAYNSILKRTPPTALFGNPRLVVVAVHAGVRGA